MGDPRILDALAKDQYEEEHPLQRIVEEIVDNDLTVREREVFFLRFGENLSIREIAEMLEYKSHWVIQRMIAKIEEKVREGIERRTP